MTAAAIDQLLRPTGRGSRAGRRAGALACLAVLSVLGCGADSDYQAAVSANTVAAFDDYLRLHPDGAHAAEARVHLAALVEDREWQRAHAAGNADAYQQYLRGYPSGAHAHDALMAIADLNLATAPSTETPATDATDATDASGAGTPSAPPAAKGPIARAPAAAAAPTAPPRVAATKRSPAPAAKPVAAAPAHAAPTAAAGVRIQLGAFGAKSGAEAAWHRLSGRYPELASRTPLIAAGKAGDGRDVARLQVGGFSRESATHMCAALAANHDACLVVPDKGPAN